MIMMEITNKKHNLDNIKLTEFLNVQESKHKGCKGLRTKISTKVKKNFSKN